MIELINDDYADFVHLSSRLVGLEDSVGKIEKDLKVRGLFKLLVVVCLRDENGISYSLEVTQFELPSRLLMISWPILPRLIFSSNKFCIFQSNWKEFEDTTKDSIGVAEAIEEKCQQLTSNRLAQANLFLFFFEIII